MMKSIKKTFAIAAMALAISAASFTAFAASQYKTPAEAVVGITGQTVDSAIAQRQETGKTYGTIAAEAGKLDEYKSEIIEIKKDNLAAQVAAGRITQEQADAIIKAIEEKQANCDGTGSAKIGRSMGARFGSNGTGLGNGGAGRGTGMGRGQSDSGRRMGIGGQGLQDGSCYVTLAN